MLSPYKTLVLLLWGDFPWCSRDGSQVSIKSGPASRFLKIPPYRLREHLRWLESGKFISDLQLEYGRAKFEVRGSIYDQS